VFMMVRAFAVTCLMVCLVATPWSNAFASERPAPVTEPTDSQPVDAPAPMTSGIRLSPVAFGQLSTEPAFSLAPASSFLQSGRRQTVASTNEPKLLLGVAAGALIVTGVAMLAYGATSTCKGLHETTSSCDKKTVIGAMAVSGGTVMLIVWSLSRP
jgi:hypothetical protein